MSCKSFYDFVHNVQFQMFVIFSILYFEREFAAFGSSSISNGTSTKAVVKRKKSKEKLDPYAGREPLTRAQAMDLQA